MLTYRPDVQGLRAVAVGMVVIYHAFPAQLPGGFIGVDVFFVISGFLISRQIADAIDERRFSAARFYAQRAKRLLPASLLVILVTLLWCLVAAPRVALERIASDAIAAALYVPNIWFAMADSDYLADPSPSPFLHYWSLGVEEQFYLFWPVLFLLLGSRVAGRRVLVLVVVLLSFAAGVIVMQYSGPAAFYLLPTRAWEFGIGALVALSASWVTRIWWRPVIGWIGLLALVGCAFCYSASTPFPGWAAAAPVLATAMTLAAGTHRGGPVEVLGRAPFRFVGDVSYSFYLWHWPAFLVPSLVLGIELPVWSKLALIAASFAAAVATYLWVEQPPRRSLASPRRVLVVASAAGVMVIAASVLILAVPSPGDSVKSSDAQERPLTPSLLDAEEDLPLVYRDGCHADLLAVESGECLYGSEDAQTRIAVYGDSHAAQWFPALEKAAEQHNAQLLMLTKSACPSVDLALGDVRVGRDYTECYSWRSSAIERIRAFDPDIVILSNSGSGYGDGVTGDLHQLWQEALTSTLDSLHDLPVVIVSDTPLWPESVPVCLSRAGASEADCELPVDELVDPEFSRIERSAGVPYIDLLPFLCTSVCGVIDGTTLIYRDDNHVTATFARSLSDELWDLLPID